MSRMAASLLAALMLTGGLALAAEPGDKVTFTIDQWRKPGSNNIGTADITINNDNDFAVKDVRVQCHYTVKATGKKIETSQTVAVTVKPKTKQTFKKTKFPFIDQQAAEGTCNLVSADKV